MSMVTLVSGGLDSTLMAILANEENLSQYPLFVDYGQLSAKQEWQACLRVHSNLGLSEPERMELPGFGNLVSSGLTDSKKRINEDAFLAGRNLLFLIVASSYAYQTGSTTVGIGLLSEDSALFPDQTSTFVENVQKLIQESYNYDIKIVAPLMKFNKHDILRIAKSRGITGTYSCHSGQKTPCGKCISCCEIRELDKR